MREIMIGAEPVEIKASPLTLNIYKREFQRQILGDYLQMVGGGDLEELQNKNEEELADSFDFVIVLQLAWAMAKTAQYPQPFPSFDRWLADFEFINLGDQNLAKEILEEANHGLFRTNAAKVEDAGETKE